MKKSHKYEEIPTIEIRCPHCGIWDSYVGDYIEGFILCCDKCRKKFELGRQK